MGRVVTVVVTHAGACAGAVGPFYVDVPWWAQVEPVLAHLEEVLGGPAVVLRLLTVAAAEPAAIAAFAQVDPGLVPAVVASAPGGAR
jgi:hypothetical protein